MVTSRKGEIWKKKSAEASPQKESFYEIIMSVSPEGNRNTATQFNTFRKDGVIAIRSDYLHSTTLVSACSEF